jgi:hypothetical protein
MEELPRYSAIAGVTDRCSEELDREIDAWEARQRKRELRAKEAEAKPEDDVTRRSAAASGVRTGAHFHLYAASRDW